MGDFLTVTRVQRVRWEADCASCTEPIRPRVMAVRLRDVRGRPSWAHADCLPGAHTGQVLCPTHLSTLRRVEEWNRSHTKKVTIELVCDACRGGAA